MNKIRRLELFLKHAKKFVSKDVSSPQLECACIRGGNGYATNNYTILIVHDVWEKKKSDTLYNMHTRELLEQSKFPDAEKFIPKPESASAVFNVVAEDNDKPHFLLPLAMWLKCGTAVLKKIDKKVNPRLELSFFKNSLIFSFDTEEVKTGCKFSYHPEGACFLEGKEPPDIKIFFNGAYFLAAVEALLDFGCSKVQFVFDNQQKPFAMYGDNNVIACLAPIRTEKG